MEVQVYEIAVIEVAAFDINRFIMKLIYTMLF